MSAYHVGFSPRKAGYLASFLGSPVRPLRPGVAPVAGEAVYVWGSTPIPPGIALSSVVRVEDGFLRSSGLGAAFAEPLSWVFDRGGAHYDAKSRSHIEELLATVTVGEPLLQRARALRERIVESGLTKYNVPVAPWPGRADAVASGRRVVLAIGQVAGDAAIRAIDTPVCSNDALLRAVREEAPDAWIVYKRHPDVVAGLRAGDDAEACRIADDVVGDVALDTLLAVADEVHVMTSLLGFEALLRGARVICHANPFYAGWDLTVDRFRLPLRFRARSLDELVALALIVYPAYRLPGGARCEVEEVVEHLASRGRHGGRRIVGQLLGRLGRTLGFADRNAGGLRA